MLPTANLHLRNLIDSALLYISPPISPARSQSSSEYYTPHSPSRPSLPDLQRPASSLRARLDAACLSPTSSLAGLAPELMRRELDSAKHELSRANADVARLDERCKMLEKTLRETREMLRVRDTELERTKRDRDRERALGERRRSDVGPQYIPRNDKELHDLYPRHSSLDIRSTAAINAGVQLNPGNYLNGSHTNGRSHRSDSDASQATINSEEERARVRSTDVYMTRTDSWSGAQVLQAVQDINSEILQFAASATEICTFDRDSRPSSARSVQAMHDTSSRIGPNLARILANRDHSQDPILVQLALQGCVTLCIARALAAFCIGFPSKSDVVLQQIYQHMHLTEPQPTSSKWRALTHSHIHTMYPTLGDYSTSELSDAILRWASDIFLIAGCQSYETSSRDGLRARFGEQVRRIARSVCRLARVTREEIMSTCFEVVVGDNSQPYDAGTMGDAFGEYGPSRGAVLATTELGLKCTTRIGTADDAALQRRTLLQPKVVLESVLDVLDPR